MSFHHWMYFGCQCSSARCSRLLLESPTLLGMRSAEIMTGAEVLTVLGTVVIEFRPRLRAVGGQRPLLANRIGPDEDPVLPGGEAPEDLGFHRLGAGEAKIRFHPREGVRRKGGAALHRKAHLVVPIEFVGREGDEAGVERFL